MCDLVYEMWYNIYMKEIQATATGGGIMVIDIPFTVDQHEFLAQVTSREHAEGNMVSTEEIVNMFAKQCNIASILIDQIRRANNQVEEITV